MSITLKLVIHLVSDTICTSFVYVESCGLKWYYVRFLCKISYRYVSWVPVGRKVKPIPKICDSNLYNLLSLPEQKRSNLVSLSPSVSWVHWIWHSRMGLYSWQDRHSALAICTSDFMRGNVYFWSWITSVPSLEFMWRLNTLEFTRD
jgi:hypothetical protein